MKKWMIGLLLLNLALFGWIWWGDVLTADIDDQSAQSSLNVDKIKLLELSAASATVPAPVLVPISGTVSTTKPDTTSGMTLTLLPTSTPVSVPISIPVSAPLLVIQAPIEAVKEPPSAQKPSSCTEWGEFSGSDLVRAQEALAMLKLGDDLSQRTVEQDHGYWVYIPPLKKRADLERKIEQLKQRGVNDYFVVQEKGPWLNAISLGMFRTEESARKFLATLRAKDVRTAKVGERTSKLKFTVFVMKELDAGTEDKLKALQKEFPDSELKVSACGD
jgi:hypothetical protein